MEQTFKKPVAQFENSFGILEFKMRFYQKTHQITYGKPAKRIILYQKCFKNIIALRGKFTYLFIQQSWKILYYLNYQHKTLAWLIII